MLPLHYRPLVYFCRYKTKCFRSIPVKIFGMSEDLDSLEAELAALLAGTHKGYKAKLAELKASHERNLRDIRTLRRLRLEKSRSDFERQLSALKREQEERIAELKDVLIGEVEEKKRQIDWEHAQLDLHNGSLDVYDTRPVATRKLRRRPNEPQQVPAAQTEKRARKASPKSFTHQLNDEDVSADVSGFLNFTNRPERERQPVATSETRDSRPTPCDRRRSPSPSRQPITDRCVIADVWVENGKLMYDSEWFCRGETVEFESPEGDYGTGCLQSIAARDISIVKFDAGGSSKVRLTLQALQKGKARIQKS